MKQFWKIIGFNVFVFGLCLSAGLYAFDWWAGRTYGLGTPVIYDNNPLYGYRPMPNQSVVRQHGAMLHFNNLGLRANQDWDASVTQDKVLFIGDSVTYGGSYIGNNELFSTLSVQSAMPTKQAGNAGVNGWGILNTQALIMDADFLPADTVISLFPEGDFIRGLSRIGGQAFWTRQPGNAIEELFHFGIYKLSILKYVGGSNSKSPEKVIHKAAVGLKQLDDYIKAQGKTHLIYITPSVHQALGSQNKDPLVQRALQEQALDVHYLMDNVQASESKETIQSWYVDVIHLSTQGHKQWAQWIANDLKSVTQL